MNSKLVKGLVFGFSILGLLALAQRFHEGLIVTQLTQHVPWGLWISLYIYFIGLSAGSFLLSTLIYVFRVKRFEPAGPLALIQALGCLILGMFLIWVDLGHPARFFNIFIYWNPTSVLAWEALFYVGYAIVILFELYLVLKPAYARRARQETPDEAWQFRAGRWLAILGIIGIPVAIGVHGGTGAIFAVVKSKPTWYTGLFPIVFLVSALASGGGLLTFLTAFVSRLPHLQKVSLVRDLARLTVGIIAFDLLLMCSEILVVFYGGIPAHEEGLREILFGSYWWVFWFVQLGLGAIIPILIVAGRKTGSSLKALAWSGALIVIGIMGVRLNIVIPAQIPPVFPTLPVAYIHPRFVAGYFPSVNEWLVGLGTVALGVLAFLYMMKILPLAEAEQMTGHSEKGGML